MGSITNIIHQDLVLSTVLKFLSPHNRSDLSFTSSALHKAVKTPPPQQKKYLFRKDFENLVIEISTLIKTGKYIDPDYPTAEIIRMRLSTLRQLVEANMNVPSINISEIKFQGDEKYLVFALVFGLSQLDEAGKKNVMHTSSKMLRTYHPF